MVNPQKVSQNRGPQITNNYSYSNTRPILTNRYSGSKLSGVDKACGLFIRISSV